MSPFFFAVSEAKTRMSPFFSFYNIRIEQVPAVWVAQQIGYHARPLLTVASSDREDVRLAFANQAV